MIISIYVLLLSSLTRVPPAPPHSPSLSLIIQYSSCPHGRSSGRPCGPIRFQTIKIIQFWIANIITVPPPSCARPPSPSRPRSGDPAGRARNGCPQRRIAKCALQADCEPISSLAQPAALGPASPAGAEILYSPGRPHRCDQAGSHRKGAGPPHPTRGGGGGLSCVVSGGRCSGPCFYTALSCLCFCIVFAQPLVFYNLHAVRPFYIVLYAVFIFIYMYSAFLYLFMYCTPPNMDVPVHVFTPSFAFVHSVFVCLCTAPFGIN